MPRAGLNTEKVVAAASELIDEVGLDNLTLAALADRLEVKLPSLYKHIAGQGDLRDRVAGAAQDESLTIMKEAAIGKTGDDAIASVAQALRRWALAHPGRYAITIVKPLRPDSAQQLLDFVLLLLASIGLTGDDAIDAARAIRASLHGFVSLESSGGFGLPADVDRSFDRYIQGLIRQLHTWAS